MGMSSRERARTPPVGDERDSEGWDCCAGVLDGSSSWRSLSADLDQCDQGRASARVEAREGADPFSVAEPDHCHHAGATARCIEGPIR